MADEAEAPAKLVGGTLERTPAVVLFRNLYGDRAHAQLLLSRRGEERTFWWEHGLLVWSASNREAQLVGETLRTFGLADESVLFAAFERALAEPGRGLAKALGETGAVPPFVADACVRALAERILFDTLTWQEGAYTLTPFGDVPPPVRFDRSNASLILEGLRRLPRGAVVPGVPVEMRARAVLASSLLLRYQQVSLLPEEADVLAKLDPERPASETGVDPVVLARLVAIGLVELVLPGKPIDVRTAVPEKLSALNAELAGAAPTSRTAEIAEQQAVLVKNTYRRTDWVNLYEILGVGRETSIEEVQRAVHDRARLFHPDQAFRSHLSDQREALETLFNKVRAAERAFRTEETRASYDAALLRGEQVVRVEDGEPTRDVQQQIARANYTRSRTLFEMGDYFPAYEMMRQAVEFDPEKWEYWVLLSRIQRKNPKWLKQSAETMRRAAARIPDNVEVLFELAEACASERNTNERTKALKQILVIDPANRRAQSALAEIAAMKPSK